MRTGRIEIEKEEKKIEEKVKTEHLEGSGGVFLVLTLRAQGTETEIEQKCVSTHAACYGTVAYGTLDFNNLLSFFFYVGLSHSSNCKHTCQHQWQWVPPCLRNRVILQISFALRLTLKFFFSLFNKPVKAIF